MAGRMEVIFIYLTVIFRKFEYFILLVIFANSITLALFDYSDRASDS